MAIHRFILKPEQINGEKAIISGDDFRHLKTIRLHKSETISISDGLGREYNGCVDLIAKDHAIVNLTNEIRSQTESLLEITLYQGMTKGSKLEMVIQKSTELGVMRIVPFVSAYSQIRIQEEREQKKQRWQEISRQAARQSGRVKIPVIENPQCYSDALEAIKKTAVTTLLFHNVENKSGIKWNELMKKKPQDNRVNLFVGPEGGFSEKEIILAEEIGVKIVELGPRIMRAETAGIVSVALVQSCWGDMN